MRLPPVRRIARAVWRRGGTRCNLCGGYVTFSDVGPHLASTLSGYGFPYALSEFETLNYRRYTCPRCGCSDRERLYALYFESALRRGTVGRLLDIAPAPALRKHLAKQSGVDYRSADLFMTDVDDIVDVTDMHSYASGTFDFFLCSHVIEHVENDVKALAELRRILRPGGHGILMAPIIDRPGIFDEDPAVTDPTERWRRFGQDDHVRLYDKSTYLARIRGAGFAVRELRYWHLGPLRFLRHGISLKSVLYVVEKRV